MALRSKLWSSETLEGGLNLARMATLGIEKDPEMVAMQAELTATLLVGSLCLTNLLVGCSKSST